MILVLADDLSGAAEIAAIATSHGLSTEVWTKPALRNSTEADLISINLDTRLLTSENAAKKTSLIISNLPRLNYRFIYLKVDSLLRGHPAHLARALMKSIGLNKTLMIPANPFMGRIIHNSQYIIDGIPLHTSDLGNDPERPLHDSDVYKMAGISPNADISIPDVNDLDSMGDLIQSFGSNVLIAGAGDFFSVSLSRMGIKKQDSDHQIQLNEKSLWICGSRTPWKRNLPSLAEKYGFHLSQSAGIPNELPSLISLAPDHKLTPKVHMKKLMTIAEESIARHSPDYVLVEGGATAMALCNSMDWNKLTALHSGNRSISRLVPSHPATSEILIKPGSFSWPDSLFTHCRKNN